MNETTRDGPKRTVVDSVQEQIRSRILTFDLKPGERLPVDRLRLEYDVSTATMREALARLMRDDLVTSQMQRGFCVRGLSLEDFRNISAARKVIEIAALRESLTARSDDWEGALMSAYHKLKLVEERVVASEDAGITSLWQDRNAEFHDCLIANCRNDWLIRFRKKLHAHSERYLRLALANNRRHRDVMREHAELFEAAIAGDVVRCERALSNHIETTVSDVERYLPTIVEETG